jgi:hypothetical protein
LTGSITGSDFTIGKITPSGGITAGPDGIVWFVEESGSKIGRITTS